MLSFIIYQNKWIPRRDENNPKTIDQIHKEVQLEEQERALMLQQAALQQRSQGGSGGGGGGAGGNRRGWLINYIYIESGRVWRQ